MRRRIDRLLAAPAVPVVAACLLVAGCASDDPSPGDRPQIGAEETTDDEPSPAAGAAEAALPTEVPGAGLELSYADPAEDREREAMAAYARFEEAVRRTLRTARLDPRLPDVAAQPVVEGFRSSVAYLRSNDIRFKGTARAAVEVEGSRDQFVSLSVCLDGTDVRQMKAGRAVPLEGRERGLVRALMFQSADRSWVVNEYRELNRPC